NGSSKPSVAGFPRPWPAVTAPPPRGHWQTPVGPLRPMTLPLETPPPPEPLPDRPPRVLLLPGRLPRARMLRTAVRLLPAQIPLMITALPTLTARQTTTLRPMRAPSPATQPQPRAPPRGRIRGMNVDRGSCRS